MPDSSILVLPIVSEGQTGKVAGFNTAIEAIERQRSNVSIAASTSPQLLSVANSRFGMITITGSLSSDQIIEIPSTMNHRLVVKNATTGGYKLKVRRQGRTATVTVPNGCSVAIARVVDDVAIDDAIQLLKPALIASRSTTTQSITAGVVIFNTESLDRGNAYNNTNGVWTAPASGLLDIRSNVTFSGAADRSMTLAVRKNGTAVITNLKPHNSAIGSNLTMEISGFIEVVEGDTIDLHLTDGAGTGVTVSDSVGATRISLLMI